MLKSVLCVLAVLTIFACGSTGSGGGGQGPETTTGDSIRVNWHDYRSGLRLELVSRSHTDRKELYSTSRSEASTKVQEDLYMLALVDDFLRGEGYYDVARRGPAPSASNDGDWHALEVELNGEVTHLTVGTGTSKQVADTYNNCRRGFIELYNATDALQTVENPDGAGFFESQKASLKPNN
jgi:hypothetical protein